ATAASRTKPAALKNSIVHTDSKPAFSARTAASICPLMSERVRIRPCFIVVLWCSWRSLRRNETGLDRFVARHLPRERTDRERRIGEIEVVRVHLLERHFARLDQPDRRLVAGGRHADRAFYVDLLHHDEIGHEVVDRAKALHPGEH